MRDRISLLLSVGLTALLTGSSAYATIFTMDIVATSTTTVGPGGSVDYQLVGELSEGSMGLALFGVDLHSSYSMPGGLPGLLPPPHMYSFVRPYGVTNPPGPADDDPANPSGYGGTPMADNWLAQIGGGQNTIGNAPGEEPFPIGDVVLDVANTPTVLAFGTAYLPTTPGEYYLELSDLFANVITGPGVGDPPVFPVEEAEGVFGTPVLNITVVPEPASIAALILGGVLLCGHRSRTAAHCARV